MKDQPGDDFIPGLFPTPVSHPCVTVLSLEKGPSDFEGSITHALFVVC